MGYISLTEDLLMEELAGALVDDNLFFQALIACIPKDIYRPDSKVPSKKYLHSTSSNSKAKKENVVEEGEQVDEIQLALNISGIPIAKDAIASVDQLREKLRQKLELITPKRKGDADSLSRKRKKREDAKNSLPASKQKKNEKSKLIDQEAKPQVSSEVTVTTEIPKKDSTQTIKEDIQFGNISSKWDEKLVGKTEQNKKKIGKDVLLKRIERMQRKIDNIPDEEKKQKAILKNAAKSALLRAQGIKVLDDPKLLKKSISREKKQKQKSAKAWADRKKAVEMKKASRQSKREESINSKLKKHKGKKNPSSSAKK